MSNAFRFQSSRVRAAFAPRKPRNALLRVAFGLLGLGLLAVLLVFGVFVGAAMLAAGLLVRLWRQRGKPVADARVVEGEYRVVSKPVLPLPR
jgi:hypothetical protein